MANNVLLRKAIDALSFNDVYLHNSRSFLKEDFDPKFRDDVGDMILAHRHVVERSQLLEFSEDSQNLFRVYIELGLRWMYEKEEKDGTEKAFESNSAAAIEATYVVEYKLSAQVDQEALGEFALNNASYHVWPYWREYLMNQCVRMNLPKVPLPMKQVANNSDAIPKEMES